MHGMSNVTMNKFSNIIGEDSSHTDCHNHLHEEQELGYLMKQITCTKIIQRVG